MSSQKNIQEEIKSLESSLPFKNDHPFAVPEGYFEGLAAAILAKVKSSAASVEEELGELSPLLAGIPKVTPYSVPFSYFNENVEVANGIIQENNSAVLALVGKEMPYNLPDGYFERFPQQVLSQVSQPKAKVVPLFARTWMRTAAAAVVAGALLFAGLQLFSEKSDEIDSIAGNRDTTESQVAQATVPLEIKQASTEELEDFIEAVEVTASATPVKKNINEDAEELLKDVSVTEMESFLSSIPTDDELLVTN